MGSDIVDQITDLIKKAAKADDSNDALKFSQAASNAASALCAVHSTGYAKKEK